VPFEEKLFSEGQFRASVCSSHSDLIQSTLIFYFLRAEVPSNSRKPDIRYAVFALSSMKLWKLLCNREDVQAFRQQILTRQPNGTWACSRLEVQTLNFRQCQKAGGRHDASSNPWHWRGTMPPWTLMTHFRRNFHAKPFGPLGDQPSLQAFLQTTHAMLCEIHTLH
jgi:hypothetical protein